jgi:Zn-dependent M28 family amino/carboxypeptidase
MTRWAVICIFFGLNCMAADFPKIDEKALLQHIRILSSDAFEGRFPGTKGEDLTVDYIRKQFLALGLKPGNPNGTYIQKVPMVGSTPDSSMALTLRKGGKSLELTYLSDFVAWTRQVVPDTRLEKSEIVFVGYGVQAPEFNWDDYKGLDIRGKTLVMLVGDPPVPDPTDPKKLDPKIFGGKAMTYYGRWTYKYDIAGEKGAAGVLLVHETSSAGYPWSVVKGFAGERFELGAPDKNMGKPKVEAWISLERARELCALAGQDYDALKKKAVTRAFRPVALGVTASVKFHNTFRTIESRNVVGKVEGKNPKLKDEFVLYTAHWDHLGVGQPVNGDRIYHGAKDNAAGVAGLIELARAFVKQSVRPERSVLFISLTGEEQGLLGSEYYAGHPLYPLSKTLAVINMDAPNTYGRTKDLTVVGLGRSELDGYAKNAAAGQGRVLIPDPEPEKGGFYRSDHFPFAKKGVPVLDTNAGTQFLGKPADYGQKKRDEYTTNDYHKPSDVIKPDWDLSGMSQDLMLLGTVGLEVANAKRFPQWKPGSEFKR